MAVVNLQRSRQIPSLGLRVVKADGQVIDFGRVSGRPMIGRLQRWLQSRRIGDYREALGLERKPNLAELQGCPPARAVPPSNPLLLWIHRRRLARLRKKFGVKV